MNEELKPQVGDVWKMGHAPEIKLLFVGNEIIIYSELGHEKSMRLKCLTDYELIYRDGKPYKPKRVFEEGAFYPIVGKCYGNKFIARVHCGRFLYATSSDYCWFETEEVEKSFLIGDKLEINWPEVTE